ncbi:hypothetical protein HK101_007870 [Irineochytrium annulatum]|nr:hypothetical protein HK101_007870 [Irineochytrium annulatum]
MTQSVLQMAASTPAKSTKLERAMAQLLTDVGQLPSEFIMPVVFASIAPTDKIADNLTTPEIVKCGSATFERIDYSPVAYRIELPAPTYDSLSHVRLNPNITPSDIAIGVTTFSARAQLTIDMVEYSLARLGVETHVFFDEGSEFERLYANYVRRPEAVNIHISGTGSGATRWFHVVSQLYALKPDAKFYLIADDDTMFFLYNLLRTLTPFNPDDPLYLGYYTELASNDEDHGSLVNMAFGGGGVVLSRKAMEIIAPHMNTCEHRYKDIFGGDERLALCLLEHGIHLSPNSHFHQLDLQGFHAGYFEHLWDMVGIHRPHSAHLWPWGQGDEQWQRLAKQHQMADQLYLRRLHWNTTLDGGNDDKRSFK